MSMDLNIEMRKSSIDHIKKFKETRSNPLAFRYRMSLLNRITASPKPITTLRVSHHGQRNHQCDRTQLHYSPNRSKGCTGLQIGILTTNSVKYINSWSSPPISTIFLHFIKMPKRTSAIRYRYSSPRLPASRLTGAKS